MKRIKNQREKTKQPSGPNLVGLDLMVASIHLDEEIFPHDEVAVERDKLQAPKGREFFSQLFKPCEGIIIHCFFHCPKNQGKLTVYIRAKN